MKFGVIIIMILVVLGYIREGSIRETDYEYVTSLESSDKDDNTKGETNMESIQEKEQEIAAIMSSIEEISNNECHADNLIKTIYSEDELTRFDPRIKTIMERNLAECVRIIDENVFYVIFKSQSRYLFLEFDLTKDYFYPINITYSDDQLVLSDFDSVKIDVSKKEDVMKIDSYGKYSSSAQSHSFSSIHFTIDGYRVYITYAFGKNSSADIVVENIEIEKISHPLKEILLSQDKGLLSDE